MKLYSTNNKKLNVSFEEAVFNSLPEDKGLYMPAQIPTLDPLFIRHIQQYSLQEIAFTVAHALLEDDIPKDDLKKIVQQAINFDAPVQLLDAGLGVLELFHGPSFAFKDFGARFMSRVMSYFSAQEDQLLDVLVATSGDTGGAVALGFLEVQGTRVTILYPKGKVSKVQEEQLTTNGHNIRALEVDGTFDDCQALVKQAFNDEDLKGHLRLTSANSINIARLIPQTFYYFWAYAQLRAQGIHKVVFSVPSGNFGNIGAGLLARKMGLPVHHFIAATNVNDTVPRFLSTGRYEPRPSVQTLSNAMDVGNPSNWVRIQDMFDHDLQELKDTISSYTFDDVQTKVAMRELYDKYKYIACPHTAIGYLAAKTYKQEFPGDYASVFLATAHPCKFPDGIEKEIFDKVVPPAESLKHSSKIKQVTPMTTAYNDFKNYLLTYK